MHLYQRHYRISSKERPGRSFKSRHSRGGAHSRGALIRGGAHSRGGGAHLKISVFGWWGAHLIEKLL